MNFNSSYYYVSACKDQIVYIFSYSNKSCALDLNKKLHWNIPPIPAINTNKTINWEFKSYGSASLFMNKILLTGLNIPNLYLYDEMKNSYVKIMGFKSSDNFKYAMKNWIITSEAKLHEFIDIELVNCKSYAIVEDVMFPLNATFCEYKKYIYFIDGSNSLMRINKEHKKIEIISYSKSNKRIPISYESQPMVVIKNNPF